MGLLRSIRYNLTNLVNFSGRETRALFWPYVGFLFVLLVAGMMAVMIPAMVSTFGKMQQFAHDHPDLATVESEPGSYSISIQGNHPELMPDMGGVFTGIGVVFIFAICLLAAAVVRRLHDRGKSGAWGLMPLPFVAFALTVMPMIFAQSTPNMTLFFAVFFNNMIYIGTLIALVVLLAGAGSVTENRYGPPSDGS